MGLSRYASVSLARNGGWAHSILAVSSLKSQQGWGYPTAWLIHRKLMQAMSDREDRYILEGKVQVDDACLAPGPGFVLKAIAAWAKSGQHSVSGRSSLLWRRHRNGSQDQTIEGNHHAP